MIEFLDSRNRPEALILCAGVALHGLLAGGQWKTDREQSINRRSSRQLTFSGATMTLTEWATRLGVGHRTIGQRLDSYGWSVEKTLTTPGRQHG
jgi:hypothetical protein